MKLRKNELKPAETVLSVSKKQFCFFSAHAAILQVGQSFEADSNRQAALQTPMILKINLITVGFVFEKVLTAIAVGCESSKRF